jgi:hypothetical protein
MSIWGRMSASVLQVVVVVEVVFWHGNLPFGVVDVERGVANRKRSSPLSIRASLFFRWQGANFKEGERSLAVQPNRIQVPSSRARVSPRSKLYRYASLSHAFGIIRVSTASRQSEVRNQ